MHPERNPLPNLVLVHGLKGSGKSTLAERLCVEHGYVRAKMADPLKNMIRSLLRDGGIGNELVERYVEGDLKEVPIPEMSGRSCRQLMETLGDQWRKMQAMDFWVDIVEAKVLKLFSEGKRVVIDDIRYLNEFTRFLAHRPATFVVTRGERHFETVEEGRHPGEVPLPVGMFDAHIRNDFDDKAAYWATVDACLREMSEARARIVAAATCSPAPARADQELPGGREASLMGALADIERYAGLPNADRYVIRDKAHKAISANSVIERAA